MDAMEKNPPSLIEMTDSAVQKVRSLMQREHGNEEKFLRISVVGGGCSGMSYKMGFESEAGEKDRQFEENGVQVLLDPKSALFLQGLRVDYEDGLNGAGFTYQNPKAKKACGCGTSFAV